MVGCRSGLVSTPALSRRFRYCTVLIEPESQFHCALASLLFLGLLVLSAEIDPDVLPRGYFLDCSNPALQDILEKCVRELGAIRLIDSRIGVPGQLACNPRVILGRFRTTISFAWLHILVLLVNLRLHSIHSDIYRTSGSLGRRFCWTRNTDATGLAGVASDPHHRWLGIFDFASRTGHRAVVG